MHQALDYVKYIYSILPKGLGYDSKLITGLALLSWAALYKVFTEESLLEGELCANAIDSDRLKETVMLLKSEEINNQLVDIEGTIEVNKEILIPRGLEEEVTIENIKSTDSLLHTFEFEDDSSLSLTKELSLDEEDQLNNRIFRTTPKESRQFPFQMFPGTYDSDDLIKIRIISNKDWGRVDWSTGSLIDENLEPIEIDHVVVDIHGGSFNSGSSAKQFQYTKYFTMKTNCVVFSIDYRTAPEVKFPGNISDSLQGYLWVAYYAEKYLQLRPSSIIIEGDSAGGNIAIGVTHLLVQKNLRIPDKLLLPYPCCGAGKQKFSPSLLLALDDLIMNAQNISPSMELYLENDDHDTNNSFVYTNDIPKKILSKFPKTFIVVLGLDPLRDEALRFTSNLAE
mmetsp:Transcript_20144/g.17844  ORF Transcript_20144/g.17844 Transcript_20144/m.17844 type:complete len:396 (-) Transcript_20144:159-1346(-)